MTSNPPLPQLRRLSVGDIRQPGDFHQLRDVRKAVYPGPEVPGPHRPVRLGYGIALLASDFLATNWFRPL